MKRFSIFALAAVAMFVGCTKDINTDIEKNEIIRGELVEMSLVIEDTRVKRDDAGKLSWSEGDQVAVILENEGAYNLDTNTYTVDHTTGTAMVPSNVAYMFYPANYATSLSGTTLTLSLPENRDVINPEDIFDLNPMKGTVNGDNVTFKNIMGYIKVPLTGEGNMTGLTVKSEIFNGFKPLSMTSSVDLSSDTGIAMAAGNTARAYVRVRFENGIDLSTSPAVYVPVPANTYANLALVVETSDNGATSIYANNSHTVTLSKIKPVSSSAINVSNHIATAPTSLNGTSGVNYNDYANTYIVPPTAGEYSFKATLCDGTELEGGVTAEIAWAEEPGMFYDFHYDPTSNTISFKTNGKKGNALVTLTQNSFDTNTIVWSWLLWCTDTPEDISIYGDNATTNIYKVMDRVIGATWAPTGTLEDQREANGWKETYMMNASVSSTDATNACGLYYQYQNMIPYPRIKDIDLKENETTANRINTRIGVQYGFSQFCQLWSSTANGGSVSVDDNGQPRTASSKNLYYMYSINSQKAWNKTPLKSYNSNNEGNFAMTDDTKSFYRLWSGTTDRGCTMVIKTTHDPCPAGYMVDNTSGYYHYVNQNPVADFGYVRNPEDNDLYAGCGGYKFYGMFTNLGTNSKGAATALYFPCGGSRSGTVCKTIGGYANMGYIYLYNTSNSSTYTFTADSKTITGYCAGAAQFGASGDSGTTIGNPIDYSASKKVHAQAYNIRCRKGGN